MIVLICILYILQFPPKCQYTQTLLGCILNYHIHHCGLNIRIKWFTSSWQISYKIHILDLRIKKTIFCEDTLVTNISSSVWFNVFFVFLFGFFYLTIRTIHRKSEMHFQRNFFFSNVTMAFILLTLPKLYINMLMFNRWDSWNMYVACSNLSNSLTQSDKCFIWLQHHFNVWLNPSLSYDITCLLSNTTHLQNAIVRLSLHLNSTLL